MRDPEWGGLAGAPVCRGIMMLVRGASRSRACCWESDAWAYVRGSDAVGVLAWGVKYVS